MAKTVQTKITSSGTCNFCKGEFDKSKMTQHLKYCKQRTAMMKEAGAGGAGGDSDVQKARIFHLLVEGKYLPMYWMHLEMPAQATMLDLDDFLRAIWVECCDHLSAFKVGKISFSSPMPDFGNITILGAPTDAEEGSDEEEDEAIEDEEDEYEEDEEEEEDNGLTLEEEVAMLTKAAKEVVERISAEFPEGLFKAKDEKIAGKVRDMMLQNGNVVAADLETTEVQDEIERIAYMLKYGMFVSSIEREYAEQDMGYSLGKALKVGTKFSYTYDFGSSTDLSLKVIAEREGTMTNVNEDDDDTVQIMSRNEEPDIPCRNCGKPATRVVPGYYPLSLGALCDTCKLKGDEKKYISEEELLPIVNSPRVGVCGYSGGADVWHGEEWDEEEEEE
jgi:hypothetical protein